jgi:NAD(P)-dependent dehydrogenase (short-subunit alcohol dehydrogenase family)
VYARTFHTGNTVIVGDSLEDVRSGLEGGARVIGVASGTTTAEQLAAAGADVVLPDLRDAHRLLHEIRAITGIVGPGLVRLITHLDVSAAAARKAGEILADLVRTS